MPREVHSGFGTVIAISRGTFTNDDSKKLGFRNAALCGEVKFQHVAVRREVCVVVNMSSEEIKTVQEQTQEKRKWRKRKTFLTNARKYAKKGRYGRGTEMDADTYQYFVRVMEAYREGFDGDEDKSIFVNNVFEQTENNEVNYSRNQVGCRVIEMLLPFASDAVLERYMAAFGSELRPLCSDRFASHVMEALLVQSCLKSTKREGDERPSKCADFTIRVSRFLLNNLEDYVWDVYGNHIIRSVLLNLSQLPKNGATPPPENMPDILDEYVEIIKDYAERLIQWPQFSDLAYTEITSGLLQVVLRVLARVDLKQLRKYLKKLIDDCFRVENENDGDSKLAQVFTSKPALMLLETALQTATPKLFSKIHSSCFAGKLVALATMRSTGFVVQKLLTHSTDKSEFESMFDELSENFEGIIQAGNTSIILALAQACKKLATKQGSFSQNLMKALHCFEPEDRHNSFVICLCRFGAFESAGGATTDNLDKEKLNLHGTLILQTLLEFNKPIKIVTGILSMETDVLRKLFSNSMGSHVVDSYAKSEFIGEKSREKLVRKLQGAYQELASSKYGSRCFEALWNIANLKFKSAIMEELAHKDGIWSNSMFGKIIASKVNMSLFKRSRDEWKNSLNKSTKVKELTDLIKS